MGVVKSACFSMIAIMNSIIDFVGDLIKKLKIINRSNSARIKMKRKKIRVEKCVDCKHSKNSHRENGLCLAKLKCKCSWCWGTKFRGKYRRTIVRRKIRVDLEKLKQAIYLRYPYLSWAGAFAHAVDKNHYEAWKEGVDFVIDMCKQEADNGTRHKK